MAVLVISVRLHDGRYHGTGNWPPSPARLFQALVAGAGLSGPLSLIDRQGLECLERLQAPIIAAPRARQPRRGVLYYMPNNDADAIGGDVSKMAAIRTATKIFKPYFFDPQIPIVYAWPLHEQPCQQTAEMALRNLTGRLYQLGRGIDFAWAWFDILQDSDFEEFLAAYPGQLFRPSERGSGLLLPTPCQGSLQSLERRYKAFGRRFFYPGKSGNVKVVFRQPPKPQFQTVSYNSPPSRQIYELCSLIGDGVFAPWPLERVYELAAALRDAAVARLRRTMKARSADIDCALVGRKPDGANDCSPEYRVRIIPLPSIGHMHADREIRRVLIETPARCLLSPKDVQWAFSGLDLSCRDSGETLATLIRSEDDSFLAHFGAGDDRSFRLWRTVTPAALPGLAAPPKIGSGRSPRRAMAGEKRRSLHELAAAAVSQALRHAGIAEGIQAIRVQREPFDANGRRAEDFAKGTRFEERRLWHVEIAFSSPVQGPLTIGDGRFLGLGVMAPVKQPGGVYAFSVQSGLDGSPEPESLARALRRAVMARVQDHVGGALPAFFSGHEPNGAPLRTPRSSHLAFVYDPPRNRFLIIAPHVLDHRHCSREEMEYLATLERALDGFKELRAGNTGILSIKPSAVILCQDALFSSSKVWKTLTRYRVTRHLRAEDARQALARDIQTQLLMHGFPEAEVTSLECKGIPGKGLEGTAELRFKAAAEGPLLLGKSRFLGGGLFGGASA